MNPKQALVVRRIFERFAAGAGCKTIAKELNAKGYASPGSSWKRDTRRASGWMNTAVRVILRNPVYSGDIVWNRAKWKTDPDTGRRQYKLLPESEWIRHTD
ncbi:MAG: recombinase family protein [Terriglobales bacterium]